MSEWGIVVIGILYFIQFFFTDSRIRDILRMVIDNSRMQREFNRELATYLKIQAECIVKFDRKIDEVHQMIREEYYEEVGNN